MLIITKDGRAALRRMAYDAIARNGALAVMPDTMLGILDRYDLMEAALATARQQLANRVVSAESGADVPAGEEVQPMTDETKLAPPEDPGKEPTHDVDEVAVGHPAPGTDAEGEPKPEDDDTA